MLHSEMLRQMLLSLYKGFFTQLTCDYFGSEIRLNTNRFPCQASQYYNLSDMREGIAYRALD